MAKGDGNPGIGVVSNITVQETSTGEIIPVAEIQYVTGIQDRIAMVYVTKDLEVLPRDRILESRCRFVC